MDGKHDFDLFLLSYGSGDRERVVRLASGPIGTGRRIRRTGSPYDLERSRTRADPIRHEVEVRLTGLGIPHGAFVASEHLISVDRHGNCRQWPAARQLTAELGQGDTDPTGRDAGRGQLERGSEDRHVLEGEDEATIRPAAGLHELGPCETSNLLGRAAQEGRNLAGGKRRDRPAAILGHELSIGILQRPANFQSSASSTSCRRSSRRRAWRASGPCLRRTRPRPRWP